MLRTITKQDIGDKFSDPNASSPQSKWLDGVQSEASDMLHQLQTMMVVVEYTIHIPGFDVRPTRATHTWSWSKHQ